ncbi:MAG: metal ABC transporter permease [Stellaceae bacterium]
MNVGTVLHRFRALASGFFGLLSSYRLELPSGPAIVLVAGLSYMLSVLLGPRDSLRAIYLRMPV